MALHWGLLIHNQWSNTKRVFNILKFCHYKKTLQLLILKKLLSQAAFYFGSIQDMKKPYSSR